MLLNPNVLNSAEARLDDLLQRVVEELQISPTRHRLAEERYGAVGRWLSAPESSLSSYSPDLYPQGSFRIRTTVHPLGRNEYDLDFVVEFDVDRAEAGSPATWYDSVYSRLTRDDSRWKKMVSKKNRCLRITYADEFHMDILPAVRDAAAGAGRLVVPDRGLGDWKPSAPRTFAEWFDDTAERVLMEKRGDMEPVPAHETADEKAPLRRSVQLLKRTRDVAFDGDMAQAPVSIVLTTLAAQGYQGTSSDCVTLTTALDSMIEAVQSAHGRLVVCNPAHPAEDLSERWDDPAVYEAFTFWLRDTRAEWQSALDAPDTEALASVLNSLFGETVSANALEKQAHAIREAKDSGLLATTGGAVVHRAADSQARRVRSNTFFGR